MTMITELGHIYEGFPAPCPVTDTPHRQIPDPIPSATLQDPSGDVLSQNPTLPLPGASDATEKAPSASGGGFYDPATKYFHFPSSKANDIIKRHRELVGLEHKYECMEPPTLTHRLWLRSDFEVEIRLPKNLTAMERVRLADFIDQIPVSDEEV